MSFRSAGSRPAWWGSALAIMITMSAAGAHAQQAPGEATRTASIATATAAAAPAAADGTTDASAALKPADAAAGQAKAAACGACHGATGNSTDPQYPKLAGQSEQYIARQLANFKSGQRPNAIMQGMATPLSAQDMRNIGAYFASQTPLPGVTDAALVERGQQLFREGDATRGIPACMACHAMDGSGNPGAIYPHLAGQHAAYVQATLTAWHDGASWGSSTHASIMPTIAHKLDSADISALASYIQGLHEAASPAVIAP